MRNPFSNKENKAMELLTKDQTARLLANGKASAEAMKWDGNTPDHFPVVKLFHPLRAATWLLSELDPAEPDIAFGLCDLGMNCAELGSVSLSEMRSIKVGFNLRIKRDMFWTATHPLSVYTAAAQEAGGIVTDPIRLARAAKNGGRREFL